MNEIENPELHPDRYGGDNIYETKKVAEHWHSTEMYRGWLIITIEKYCSRYGKKDDCLKEAYKIANYGRFLVEFEEKIAAGMDAAVACKQIAEKIETEENFPSVKKEPPREGPSSVPSKVISKNAIYHIAETQPCQQFPHSL